ncbi:neurofilament triplet H protein, putative [Trichomonas vaginalis G3]|uniref:Neurofilament triplet H protein, putative n=2 Tax=Trichomonas vaginalis (strain ATCC PRA-98 / G3) TaxID=412133 RepID=A2DNQ8_TRIV3|nr:neurofilament triplet H protein, putative [Trichomonas vaginalis G3]|eukprot:XP_001578889.1 neurofilament triplet H protein [Trichomonas vaginalis G3]
MSSHASRKRDKLPLPHASSDEETPIISKEEIKQKPNKSSSSSKPEIKEEIKPKQSKSSSSSKQEIKEEIKPKQSKSSSSSKQEIKVEIKQEESSSSKSGPDKEESVSYDLSTAKEEKEEKPVQQEEKETESEEGKGIKSQENEKSSSEAEEDKNKEETSSSSEEKKPKKAEEETKSSESTSEENVEGNKDDISVASLSSFQMKKRLSSKASKISSSSEDSEKDSKLVDHRKEEKRSRTLTKPPEISVNFDNEDPDKTMVSDDFFVSPAKKPSVLATIPLPESPRNSSDNPLYNNERPEKSAPSPIEMKPTNVRVRPQYTIGKTKGLNIDVPLLSSPKRRTHGKK